MINFSQKLLATLLASVGALGVSGAAHSASTWSVDGCSTSSLSSGCGATGDQVKATAYSVKNYDSGTLLAANQVFESATLSQWGSGSGLGVTYSAEVTSAPEHTMDNNLRTELIAFQFDKSVILDSITLGWTSSDADFTLMAFTGAGTPAIAGQTVSSLASGWSLVQNYGDVDAASAAPAASSGTNVTTKVNLGGVSSSWWIISAYNSGYGAGLLDSLADYMKVMTIASRDPAAPLAGGQTPEPGSLALMGIAMAGFLFSRRRKTGR